MRDTDLVSWPSLGADVPVAGRVNAALRAAQVGRGLQRPRAYRFGGRPNRDEGVCTR